MNTTIAIVLALGGIAGALYLVRRKAAEEGATLCQQLGAIDGKAGAACGILGALGINGETLAKVPSGFVKGVVKTPTFVGGAITGTIEGARDAIGLGGDGNVCSGTYGLLGFRSQTCCQTWTAAGRPNLNEWHRTHASCAK